MTTKVTAVLAILCILLAAPSAFCQDSTAENATPAEDSNEELAKQTQNPIADLISLPFQNNINYDVGPKGKTQNTLNIQPVIPFTLDDDWNLITRTIIPIIYQPEFYEEGSDCGLGDIQFTSWFSPKDSEGLIWGLGPAMRFPTATEDRLGAEKFSLGPSVVILNMKDKWVYGALAQNLWSVAGTSSRESVNEFLLQPFVNYNFGDGWYVTSSPIITANWKAGSEGKWTIPIGGGIGRTFRIGKMPINVSTQALYNIEKPDNGPDWTLRLQLQLLFPK